MRKEAAKFVNRGRGSLAEGIRSSIRDANLRTEYYIEAVAMAGVKRARSPHVDSKRRETAEDSPGPKRKHKQTKKGKGKGSKGRKGETADERGDKAHATLRAAKDKEKLKFTADVGGKQVPICLRFNRCEACADCKFEHVCLRCRGAAPFDRL